MKFLKKTLKSATIKIYKCPVCGYKVETITQGGTEEKVIGDKDFILFPFISLAALDRTTKELCACPKCNTVQYIEYIEKIEDETLVFENESGRIS